MNNQTTKDLMVASGRFDKEKRFWIDKLGEEMTKANFPYDFFVSNSSAVRKNINFDFPYDVTQRLNQMSSGSMANLYMILYAGVVSLLYKYTGITDIIVGAPINKQKAEKDLIGTFIVLRNSFSDNMTFRELLLAVRNNLVEASANQNYPIELLLKEMKMPVNDCMQSIIQALVMLSNIHDEKYIEDVNANIIFSFTKEEDRLACTIGYNSELYTEATIGRIIKHYIFLLQSITANINISLNEIDVLSELEKQQQLESFNNTYADYSVNKTIHKIFEEQAEKTPDNIAAVYEGSQITYRELNSRANQLARVLIDKGVKKEHIVGILVEPSLEMLTGIMAVLKAGGAYLPIDTAYPTDRIEYMLSDSGTTILLTQTHLADRLEFDGEILLLDDGSVYSGDSQNIEVESSADDLAYVIYTSGSTGKPKGVMVEHSSLVNLSMWHKEYYEVTEQDRSTKYAGFSFDASVWEIFPYLTAGAAIHIIPEEIRLDIIKLNKYFENNGISISFLPTQICEQFMRLENKSLRVLLTGGDKLKYYAEKSCRLVNNYGPTENTVVTTCFEVDGEYANIPIGKPIANSQIYIVDKYNKLQPVGVAGELCIGGRSLARGYLRRPELTAEKFVANPFAEGERMYRSGDLARWLPDGNIEFLGRLDYQVKIRGFRIELGEIESRLLSCEGVKEAVVIDREGNDGNKYLCAYATAEGGIDTEALKKRLSQELPDYMIPSYILQMDNIPLTQNGKVDRKALPEPDIDMTIKEYEAPRNETEERLVSLWQEVLGVERIGINDSFFELGGHSLKATTLAAKICKEFNIEMPLMEIFKAPTIKAIAKYIDEATENRYSSISVREDAEGYSIGHYPLSSAQKRIYTLQQFEGKGTSYNIPTIMTIEGRLDRRRLEEAFRGLVKRHESLRTSFELVDGEPVQRIHQEISFNVAYVEVNECDTDKIVQQFARPFEISEAPLFRVGLARLSEEQHILMLDIHHIISDGTSMGIMINEFVKLYHGEELSELKLQYKDYSVWQNKLYKSEKLQKQEQFWLDTFSEEIPVLALPADYPRLAVQSFEGDHIDFEIDSELTQKLRSIAKATGSTMYMVLLAAYNVLLSKYSGQEDIVVGSPIAGRPHADLQNIIGMFINTLAMRNYPTGDKSFREFLLEVRDRALKAFENQEYQFEELVEKLSITRDMSRNPLFDVMFAMQNMDMGEMAVEGLSFKPYDYESSISKFDITLTAAETEDTIGLVIEYCTRLFKRESMERLLGHYINILKEIAKSTAVRLCDMEILTEEERQQILHSFNDTVKPYPKDKAIHQLFEEQAEKAPDNIALVFGSSKLSYKELNEKANQLARMLKEKGAVSEGIVGLLMDRSSEMLISIMAVLKAGGAYLPIDPSYPQDRIEFLLKDSNAVLLLVQNKYSDKVGFRNTINIDDESIYTGENTNPLNPPDLSRLAYMIYTSGSTGKPKGVMVEHGSLMNTLYALQDMYPLRENDAFLFKTTYTFDVSVAEIFGWIMGAGRLVILEPGAEKEPAAILRAIKDKNITHINFVPSMFNAFMSLTDEEEWNRMNSLKYVMIAGEAISAELAGKINAISSDISFENLYGPTEATIYATGYSLQSYANSINVPIGKPFANTRAYVLSKNNRLQPVGVLGELCLAGEGITRGYLTREELTKERFVEDIAYPGERMYKTGDLVKWLPDGNIEYLGRIDHQVKIRGFRIELGEIESRLLNIDFVKEAVAIAHEDRNGSKSLCAYVVVEDRKAEDRSIVVSEIGQLLRKELPEYMLPSYTILMDKLPLNSNGKIDRKALPEPEGNISVAEYEAPRTEFEEKLAVLWQAVLGVERIGINDSFFELGGHSLKGVNLVAKIRKEFNIEMTLMEIFKAPTIKAIAKYIEEAPENQYSSISKIEAAEGYSIGHYPLSSAQKRIYTLQQFEGKGTSYNIPTIMTIEGRLDRRSLEEAFRGLVKRHESLRTSFELVDGEPVQRIHKEISFNVAYTEVNEGDADRLVQQFVSPFELSEAPLFRVGLLRLSEEQHILMLDIHHIISDGTSMGIMINEFMKLYHGEELPELKLQYKDYSVWQNKLYKSEKLQKQEQFWLDTFSEEIPVLALPADYPRPTVQSFEGDHIDFEIDSELTQKLRSIAKATGATMYMVLLAAYNVLLSKYSGQEDIVVGSPIAGRPHADLQNIIGMFINTLAMRNYPTGDKSFREFLLEVRERALKAFENQEYQFEELVEKLSITRDMSRNPLFDVMLAMQNMDMGEAEAGDLKFAPYSIINKSSKFDMTLTAMEAGEGICLTLEYCTRLFKKGTVERFSKHFISILRQVAVNTEVKLSKIEMLSEQEKQQLLHSFNDTYADYPANKTIHQLFEEQVEKTPDNIAVVYEEICLTYRELNEKANQLACVLRGKGAGPDTITGIMVERGPEMIIGIMGILKSGGAYLPIDPEYPKDRIEYMLIDSNASILLTQSNLTGITEFKNEIVLLDDEKSYSLNGSNLPYVNTSKDLSYVIYTSGSTGKPKGVMIEHYSVVNLIYSQKRQFNIVESDRIMQFSTYCFDASVEQIFIAILSGAALILVSRDKLLNINSFEEYLIKQEITHLHAVPSFLNEIGRRKEFKLKRLIAGGDICPADLVEKWYKHCEFYNEYGPTETTVTSVEILIKEDKDKYTIGKPIANTRLYIVGRNNNLQPVGVPGELCITGDGLARGYLNRQELTEEKFVDNPFDNCSSKMYRTGDLAKWLPDGSIEFLGRIDHQVKIRGFRIELGEIESRLVSYDKVREAVVAAKDDNGTKFLCAYYTIHNENGQNAEVSANELREYLSEELPDYMVPVCFVQLENMPLTSLGKIDRKALQEHKYSFGFEAGYEAPGNEIEERVSEIWKSILKLDRIGINDSFFELGGHSLKAVSLLSKIKESFKVNIPMSEILLKPTIRGMAVSISKMKADYINSADNNVILLKKGKNANKNIFIIHDGTGEISGYTEFINTLDSSFNYWGIVADRLSGYAPENVKVEVIAEKYIKKLKTIQPQGPYNIIGWSLGGIIAFEMVKQLENNNEQIGYLTLIDTFTPKKKTLNSFLSAIGSDKFSAATERRFIESLIKAKDFLTAVRHKKEKGDIWEAASEYLQKNVGVYEEFKKALHSISFVIADFDNIEVCELIKRINLIRTLNNAAQVYLPSEGIDARFSLIKAKDSSVIEKGGWRKYCSESINEYEIDGDHFSIMKPPHVNKLAKVVNSIIVKGQQSL